jgi:hypothetical protein
MVIFYNKETGQIVASFPEAYIMHPGIKVSFDGENTETFNKMTLTPEESKDFEDPRNPKNIHDYKVILKDGEPQGLQEIK